MADSIGLREDLYNVTVILVGADGKKCKFTFDKMDGGDVTSKDRKYRASNGTEDELSLGGGRSVSNITTTALMTYAMYLWVPWMLEQTGKATMYVNKQPLDNNGAPYGKALAYHGKLVATNPPKTDSESDSPSLLSLTCSAVTPVTTG
ncbi:MAG: hypothetical protein ACXVXP_00470 [Mycobacteriaceae bacterium]